ncbi:MAG: S8 family serine peptidase [Clostridia bacterium]|nr:S8 family serine peptidase [Clostridia bacterium]
MKRSMVFSTVFALFFCMLNVSSFAAGEMPTSREDADYDGYLVFLADSTGTAVLAETSDELTYVSGNIYKTYDRDYAALMLACGQAEYVEPDYIATLCDTVDVGEYEDISYGWPYVAMEADYAEDAGLDGTGVRIAIIDSGIDMDNPDLSEANIAEGYNYVEGTSEMTDDVYHGTKVAQLICADKNGAGLTGMARGAEIVPLRCFSSTFSPNASLLMTIIDDAVNVYGCDVINMSWSLDSKSAALYGAVERAYSKGVTLVAAAGNTDQSRPQGKLLYPAAYDHVIGVTSVNRSLSYALTAQHTLACNVCAPGDYIRFIKEDGTGVTSSGSSFAAPCVTAAAAVVKGLAPGMKNADVYELFTDRALDLGDEGYDTYYGYGFIRFDALLGTHWEKAAKSTDGSIIMSSWIISPGGGYILSAAYNEAGRLTGSLSYETDKDYGFVKKLIVPGESDSEIKLFYLDRDGAPVTEAVSLPIQ